MGSVDQLLDKRMDVAIIESTIATYTQEYKRWVRWVSHLRIEGWV